MVKILLQIPGLRTIEKAKEWGDIIGKAFKENPILVIDDEIDVKLLDASDDATITIYLKDKAGDVALYTTEKPEKDKSEKSPVIKVVERVRDGIKELMEGIKDDYL